MTQNFQQNNGKGPDKGPDKGPPLGGSAGSGAPPRKPEKKPFSQRTVTVTMTWPRAFFSAFFSLFVLIWVFIFGIMLGRGHNPEEVVPDLAKVMPSPREEVRVDDNSVLQSRDLRYHETLKGKNAGDKPRATPVTADPPKPAAQPEKPAPPTKPAAAPAQPKPAGKPASPPVAQAKPAPPVPVPAKPAPAAAPQDTTVYNYLYQVAAFNNNPAAEGMRKKLASGGLSARVAKGDSNGVTWYRILVAFKGTPDDTRILREKLSGYGISHIILRGKAPEKRGTP